MDASLFLFFSLMAWRNTEETLSFFVWLGASLFSRGGWPLLACPPIKKASNDAKQKKSAFPYIPGWLARMDCSRQQLSRQINS